MTEAEQETKAEIDRQKQVFCDKMEDDLNTADAITAVFELVRIANVSVTESSSRVLCEYMLRKLMDLLGILGIRLPKREESLDTEVEKLIAARQEARGNKDFQEADRIRDRLLGMGIRLKDTREGVQWSRI